MTCERAQPLISALIDGEITAAERERVLAHVRGCAHCTALYDDYRRLRRSMRDLASVQPPPDLAAATWRRIAAERRLHGRWRGRARALTGAAVAIAAALIVAVPLSSPGGDGRPQFMALLGAVATEATATVGPQRQVFEPPVSPTATPVSPSTPTATATAIPPSPTARPALPTPVAAVADKPVATVTSVDSEPEVTATPKPAPRAPAVPATRAPVSPTLAPTPRPATATTAPSTSTPEAVPATPTRVSPTVTQTRVPATASPTRVPPTATPAPTATATRPPAPVVGASFAAAYAASPAIRTRIGAPLQAERGVEGLTQSFERGLMDSFADAKQIYVLYRDGHTWARFADTWMPDEVVTPGDPAPAGLHRPRRGFGKVWRENPSVRERIGWATTPDETFAARIQRFERGQLVNSNGAIYALFEDGAWERLG